MRPDQVVSLLADQMLAGKSLGKAERTTIDMGRDEKFGEKYMRKIKDYLNPVKELEKDAGKSVSDSAYTKMRNLPGKVQSAINEAEHFEKRVTDACKEAGINVADLTHELRRQKLGNFERSGWAVAATHYGSVKTALRGILAMAQAGRSIIGDKAMSEICSGLHRSIGIPLWTPAFPGPYGCRPEVSMESGTKPKVVYFPSCLNQTMGASRNGHYNRPLVEETTALLEKAGYEVIFPSNIKNLCCGMIWESKGMPDIADRKTEELEKALRAASDNGKYPILCDKL